MCVIVSVHVCLFACVCIGVCGSYFINVFLSHLLRQRGNGEEGEGECVCMCVHGPSVFERVYAFQKTSCLLQ